MIIAIEQYPLSLYKDILLFLNKTSTCNIENESRNYFYFPLQNKYKTRSQWM